jgi:hypothetical protein
MACAARACVVCVVLLSCCWQQKGAGPSHKANALTLQDAGHGPLQVLCTAGPQHEVCLLLLCCQGQLGRVAPDAGQRMSGLLCIKIRVV